MALPTAHCTFLDYCSNYWLHLPLADTFVPSDVYFHLSRSSSACMKNYEQTSEHKTLRRFEQLLLRNCTETALIKGVRVLPTQ